MLIIFAFERSYFSRLLSKNIIYYCQNYNLTFDIITGSRNWTRAAYYVRVLSTFEECNVKGRTCWDSNTDRMRCRSRIANWWREYVDNKHRNVWIVNVQVSQLEQQLASYNVPVPEPLAVTCPIQVKQEPLDEDDTKPDNEQYCTVSVITWKRNNAQMYSPISTFHHWHNATAVKCVHVVECMNWQTHYLRTHSVRSWM
jgi:hypothetical protein